MAETAPVVLEVLALSAQSSRSTPVGEVSFALDAGGITALIGPAGGGRRTLVDALAGLALECNGTIRLGGRDLQRLDHRQRLQAGLLLLPSEPALLPGASAAQALALAWALLRRPLPLWPRRPLGGLGVDHWRAIKSALERTGLEDVADQPVSGLPLARRRALQLAQALLARPRLLLLDHPWRGLDRAEREAHARLLAGLREAEIGILLVESDLALLAEIADRVLVMAGGRLIADATPGALGDDTRVRAAFLGRAA